MIKYKQKACLLSLITTALTAFTWIYNMGFVRMGLLVFLVPLWSLIALFVTNNFAFKYAHLSPNLKKINRVFNITFFLSSLFLPDGEWGRSGRFFLGAFEAVGAVYFLCGFFILTTLALFVYQIVEITILKKQTQR